MPARARSSARCRYWSSRDGPGMQGESTMQAGRSAGELLSAARRKAAEGIIFDLGDSGAAAPFRATSHGSRNIGVGIAGGSWVLSEKAFQKIEDPLESRPSFFSIRHRRSYSKSESTNSLGSNGNRSPAFSPTPT